MSGYWDKLFGNSAHEQRYAGDFQGAPAAVPNVDWGAMLAPKTPTPPSDFGSNLANFLTNPAGANVPFVSGLADKIGGGLNALGNLFGGDPNATDKPVDFGGGQL